MKHNIATSFIAASALASLAFSYGCSSSSSSGSSAAKPGSTGPVVDASKLGGDCSGGTSDGDSVAFNDNTCPAGVCIADATGGGGLDNFKTYCSADCSNAQCPSGYICKATTIGGTNDCFIDPNAPANDAGSSSSGTTTGPSSGGACVTLSGSYNMAATQAPSNVSGTCADIPAGTTTAFDQSDAGTGCSQTFDPATCTYTNYCTTDDGEGNTSKLTIIVDTTTLKGSFDLVSSSTDEASTDCTYEVTLSQ